MKGSYCLLVRVSEQVTVRVGALGKLCFGPGLYVYIGSGMGGLEQRVERHLRKEKKLFWHIDYLLADPKVKVVNVYCKDSARKEECSIAERVSRLGEPVNGFGCSDCRCRSHLFKVDSWPGLKGFKEFTC